jgi:hypothetical protein
MELIINQISLYIKYLISDCYEEDYDPFYAKNWLDNYKYEYTFAEWYFFYRKRFKLTQFDVINKKVIYRHTPNKLIIGSEIYIYKNVKM